MECIVDVFGADHEPFDLADFLHTFRRLGQINFEDVIEHNLASRARRRQNAFTRRYQPGLYYVVVLLYLSDFEQNY